MNPTIATAIFSVGILGLFWLNYDRTIRTSKALWIPVVWLLIAGSRAPSSWFQAPSPEGDIYLEGNPFERYLFSVILFFALLVAFSRGEKIRKVLSENFPILLFIFYCAFSLMWADYPSVGFKRWTKLVGDLVMVLIVVTDANPSAAFNRLITRTGFLLVPISVLFVRYYPSLGRGYDPWTGTAHWTGVTANKNSLGMICMLIGLAELWRILQEFRNEERENRFRALTPHVIIFCLVLYLLHAADSATSNASFALGGILIVAISLFPLARKPAITHLLAIGLVLVAACAAFFDIAGLLQQVGRSADLTGRRAIWSAALSLPVSKLFGAGYETFWLGQRLTTVEEIIGTFLNQAHDGYIEILLNLGWIGVSLLALIIVNGYWKISRAVRLDPNSGSLKLAFFVAAVVYNFTEAAFKMTVPVWICFIWAIVSSPATPELVHSRISKIGPGKKVTLPTRRGLTPRPVPFEPNKIDAADELIPSGTPSNGRRNSVKKASDLMARRKTGYVGD